MKKFIDVIKEYKANEVGDWRTGINSIDKFLKALPKNPIILFIGPKSDLKDKIFFKSIIFNCDSLRASAGIFSSIDSCEDITGGILKTISSCEPQDYELCERILEKDSVHRYRKLSRLNINMCDKAKNFSTIETEIEENKELNLIYIKNCEAIEKTDICTIGMKLKYISILVESPVVLTIDKNIKFDTDINLINQISNEEFSEYCDIIIYVGDIEGENTIMSVRNKYGDSFKFSERELLMFDRNRRSRY